MAYLRHLIRCNTHDLSRFWPVQAGGAHVGWIRPAIARSLQAHGGPLRCENGTARVLAPEEDFAGRSAALDHLVGILVEQGQLPKRHGELYPVVTHWGREPLAVLDRAAAAIFGIRAFGLHVNGYVRKAGGGMALWVARRAHDRLVEPGKLDNIIAGGQPYGKSLWDNLLKEAREEAGFGPDIASRAIPTGLISYTFETPAGLRPDTLFVYDLELPPGTMPYNTDGEVESFMLWPLEAVAASIRDSDDWKFNCPLIVIDFLIRHGWLTPEHPHYPQLVQGLRAGFGGR